jgi:hypothetical protein
MSLNELIIDTIEPEEKDTMHIHPSRFNTAKYLSKNIFDRAIIRHSTVDQITSNGLSSIYSCLKPEGKIIIIVHQPIGIMVFYDTKQIEANLKLAGFENIKITDISYPDEKLNTNIPTQQIEAEKLKTEKNYDVRIEVQKITYKEKVPIENKNKINISKENKYKPKENKTYEKKEVREEVIIKDKKDENKETGKYKNRTYVREQKEEKKENSDNKIDDNNNSMEGKRKYIQRRYRFKKNS